ncbi:MAG: MBL fold metallo-hydrolase [Patescibacteria group bacterium]|nr:MBL fold metallo-hydrolase [Patescibacteria group bacterium]MDD5164287.1 MBL fold metallo-hydrolase [Patescibacteria group bacterium]MDD5535032.1 MBL fold metallo-hydrolase [Patescibacteria group bacterium]
MSKIKVLIQGYAKEKNGQEFASSTTTLIQEKGLNIIVDPGMNRKLLLTSLKKQGLTVLDINYVILTHDHSDHCLLAGIFEKAKILDADDIYSWDGKITGHNGKVPGTEIKIIKTPGHAMFHCSVLVQTKELGKTAIVGDVFWWADEEKQKTDQQSLLKHKDPYVKNEKLLLASRKKILKTADYIIPGHGKMFETGD